MTFANCVRWASTCTGGSAAGSGGCSSGGPASGGVGAIGIGALGAISIGAIGVIGEIGAVVEFLARVANCSSSARRLFSSCGTHNPRIVDLLPLSVVPTGHVLVQTAPDQSTAAGNKGRCRANMAHTRQSQPDSGLGLSHFQVNIAKTFSGVIVPPPTGQQHESTSVLLHNPYAPSRCSSVLVGIWALRVPKGARV